MNIFTAAVTGFTVVIKKIGIGFKAVMTGFKIATISVIDFIASVITAIVNAILSAIKWVVTQIVNLIHLLFRTYLRLEAGCVPPVQKFAGLMIRMRWGFVILSGLYAVYQYFGITALLVAIAVCGGLVAIGYSEAEKEEEEWNATLDKFNRIIVTYLKYLIRLAIMLFSVYSLHIMFHNNFLTILSSILSLSIIFYSIKNINGENRRISGFIKTEIRSSHASSEEKDGVNMFAFIGVTIWLIVFSIVIISHWQQ